MEVSGIAVAVVPAVSIIFQLYETLLRGPSASNSRWRLLHSRLLVERARFETNVQQLSTLSVKDYEEWEEVVNSLLAEMSKSLEKAASLMKVSDPRRTLAFVKFGMLEDNLSGVIRNASELNDKLQDIQIFLKQRHLTSSDARDDRQMGKPSSASTGGKPVLDEISASLSALTRESAENIEQRVNATESSSFEWKSAHAPRERPDLQHLVDCCCSLLKHFGEADPKFVESSNYLQLWRHGIETEGLYDAMDHASLDSGKIQRQSLRRLLLQSVVRIGEVLMWWKQYEGITSTEGDWHQVFAQGSTAVTQARSYMPELPVFDPDNIFHVNCDQSKSSDAVARTIKLLVDNLVACLPSITDFARQYNIPNADMAASDVAQLLDISVELIEPAAKALLKTASEAAASDRSKESVTIDFNSIQRVFDEQALLLQKWKAKYRQDIETKLAEKNPAKLAAAADAVGNIASILAELPASLEVRVDKGQAEQSLDSIMKAFETSVQSLVTLEQQLESIKPPPTYSEISSDRVVIDMAGIIVRQSHV